MKLTPSNIKRFNAKILQWYQQHGRKDLPWQRRPNGYRVWVSEIMLQQTQVSTVIEYYQRFMQQLPTVTALANAATDNVLHLWSGLGYYARARNLHKTAMIIQQRFQGRFPRDIETLQQLPGIGRSTAGAIVSLAFNQPATLLDGNVKRVLSRHFTVNGEPGKSATLKQLWQIAETLTPNTNNRAYNQAMMDLGAMLCTRSKPQCHHCPVHDSCLARQTDSVHRYPNKKSQLKPNPTKQCYFLLIRDQYNRVLLCKRPAVGLWGGLWCFPDCALDTRSIAQYLQSTHGIAAKEAKKLPIFDHQFSHFKLIIHPLQLELKSVLAVQDNATYHWHTLDAPLPGGIPVPVAKLLNQLRSETNVT